MGLPWIRLDTSLADHPKMLNLVGDRHFQSALVYVMSMTWSGKHGTDGFIPKSVLPFIHARKADADKLVASGFWDPAPGGWQIHGWDEYQVSDAETQERSKRAREAARKRWEKK